ncbi:MAG: NeuD/PglB/VioB family sugar acetyltransferase [Pseudomonadota bacterium]
MPTDTPLEALDTRPQLLIFGAGGHGRVVADAALLAPNPPTVVASDRNADICHGELLPSVCLKDAKTAQLLNASVHIAIGSNQAREKEAGFWGHYRLLSVFHPAACVSPFCRVAAGSFVAAGAVIAPGAVLGVGVIVNHGAVVDHDVQVGDFSHIAPNASLGGHVSVGRRVLIGAGAVILPSVSIADDVTVGAGAVVTTNLTAPGIYAGIPARKIK